MVRKVYYFLESKAQASVCKPNIENRDGEKIGEIALENIIKKNRQINCRKKN